MRWVLLALLFIPMQSPRADSTGSFSLSGAVPEIVHIILDQNALAFHSTGAAFTLEWLQKRGSMSHLVYSRHAVDGIIPLDVILDHSSSIASLRITAP